ncbi:MAG: hypothetical protein J5855_03190, partial [Mailhella sp.]|nr:hypothetical protein [Mailhella sp.]
VFFRFAKIFFRLPDSGKTNAAVPCGVAPFALFFSFCQAIYRDFFIFLRKQKILQYTYRDIVFVMRLLKRDLILLLNK